MRLRVNAGVVLGTMALVVSCCVGAVVAYDHRHVFDFLPDTTRTMSAAEVEVNAKVRLPAGTTLLSAVFKSTGGGLDTFVYAKFRFARAVLKQFLTDSGLADPALGLRAVADKDAPPSGTWHPDGAVTVSGIHEDQPYQQVYRNLLVDLDHEPDVTVYLVASRP
jgi:hypothetical protein